MLKVILFLLAGAVVIVLAWVLASIPGHVVASIGAFTIETSTPMAILMLVALFVVTFILMRILRGDPGNPPIRRGLAPPPSPCPRGKNRHARAGRLGRWGAGRSPERGPPGA